jgi:hypothetical protein
MKKITFKYTKSDKVVSMVVDDADAYINMMHNVMKSTPIEVLSIVDASEQEAGLLKAQESYFTKYGTACE